MPTEQTDEDLSITLKFGGGQNSSASEDEIDEREASFSQNTLLDFKNQNLRNRLPIDLLGTAPNAEEIRGFATLVKSDGKTTLLVQAGVKIFSFTVRNGFVDTGFTVNADMKMRRHLHHYWSLDDIVIITDVNEKSPVLEWDGGTLSTMPHNLTNEFKSKYCFVEDERARYANITSNSTPTEHMIVTSKVSDHRNLSISDKPTSALGDDDPYFLLTPDLRAINGLSSAFGVMAVSSELGSIYSILGQAPSDTSIDKFFPRSFASGDESMTYVGNDIVYGRIGRIETLASTNKFGDVEADDLSQQVRDEFKSLKDWTIVYNQRTDKIYFHPAGEEFIWEYTKSMINSGISPWNRIVTANTFKMKQTAMMQIIDPADGLEYIFMGDAAGNIYRMEGTGKSGDAGSSNISMKWRSKLFKLPPDFNATNFEGYISYRSLTDETVTVKFLFAGSQLSDENTTVAIKKTPGRRWFGGGASPIHFSNGEYFGLPFEGRFRREALDFQGTSEEVQIEVQYDGVGNIEISEIGIRFEASN